MTHTGKSGICFFGASHPPHNFDLIFFFFTTELFHKLKPEARGTIVLGLLETDHTKGSAKK